MTQFRPARPVPALLVLLLLVLAPASRADVVGWSDDAWNAARQGDAAGFDKALQALPPGDGASLQGLRDAVAQRNRNLAEAAKARDEAIARHRREIQDELAADKITRALVAAANLKFLLEAAAWNQELQGPTLRDMEAKAEAVRARAEAEGDWLLAQEMLFRLRALREDTPDAARFKQLDDQLDRMGRRVTLMAAYAPRRLHELRRTQNERFKANQTEEDRAKARARLKARLNDADDLPEEDPDRPFPEFNPASAEDWKEQYQGITPYMLREGLRKAATEHIENGGWKPLLEGGIDQLLLLASTPECRESFPRLAEEPVRNAWLAALRAARSRVDEVPQDKANTVLYREVMAALLKANEETVQIPEAALLHEFGDGATGVLSRRFEDPYSEIIWPERLRRFRQQVEGNFVGVGILIRHDEKRDIEIINPLEGSPAARAGIKPGDRIVAVDGQSTTGWSLNRAVDLITGPEGEVVTLTLRREGSEAPMELPLTRESIKMRSVNGWRKTGLTDRGQPTWDWFIDPDAGIGYVKLTSFNEDSFDDFLRAVGEMQRERTLHGLVLDVRGNPGGLLTSATDFCNLWVPEGELVSTQNRFGETTSSRRAEPNRAMLKDLPVVVLVNQSSASASEILSGCLQAYDRAVVVGERSFGKGSVQEVSPLRDRGREAAMKVTTQHYVLPPESGAAKGRLVHKTPGGSDWGVRPDLEVRMTPDQLERLADLRVRVDTLPEDGEGEPADPEEILETGADPQLETALLALRARLLGKAPATAVAEVPARSTPAVGTP
jgi:carboxyl-terminal processing protease